MAKAVPQLDALVLGDHPAAYLAAALLAGGNSKLRVLHAKIPGEVVPSDDRLALINPEYFAMHESLERQRKKVEMTPVFGVQFLADNNGTRSEHRAKTPIAFVAWHRDVRDATCRLAKDEGVAMLDPKTFEIESVDERGLHVRFDGETRHNPKVLVLGGRLSAAQEKMLALPDAWGQDVVHRYTFLKIKSGGASPRATLDVGGEKPVVVMSLDLRGMLCWAWVLPHGAHAQIAVEQPVETLAKVRPLDLLRHWVGVLHQHGVLKTTDLPIDDAHSVDLPFGGALAHEGVGNRTLLVGPAGGFFSATGEDIYPNCWSALYAAEVVKKALKEPHLQDALQPYRQRWRTTLGDYMRGPQQNLRYLLPLVYRNQVMATRLAESILLGKSVVR